MELDWIEERAAPPLLSRAMWCQCCFQGEPRHMVWFTVFVRADDKFVVSQMVCDACLIDAVESMDNAARRRRFAGETVTMVRVALL